MKSPRPIHSSCIIGRPPGVKSVAVSKLYEAPQMVSHPKSTRMRYIVMVTQSIERKRLAEGLCLRIMG